MKTNQRRSELIDYLGQNGSTSVSAFAELFKTSEATIRNDLRLLDSQGIIIRNYGGVELRQKIYGDIAINEKQKLNIDIKKRIAKKAVEFIQDGDSIILDNGSTTLQMIPLLKSIISLTLMTNGLQIVNLMMELNVEHNILMPGGTLRPKSASFHGVLAENAFSNFSFDTLFIGADGFDIKQGATTFNESYQVSQAMCQSAKRIIMMFDSSKFGRRSPNVVVPIEKIDIVITDSGISEEFRDYFLDHKEIELIII